MTKLNKVEWKDLSNTAKNVLERCWFSVTHSVMTSFTVPFGEKLYGESDIVNEEVVHEILNYQKYNPHFNVRVNIDQTLFVSGAYPEGDWLNFNNELTELGKKSELEVGDLLYYQRSFDISNMFITKVIKVLKNDYVLDTGIKIPKQKINVETKQHIISDDNFSQTFYSRETVFLKEAYQRNSLINEFEDLLDLRTISNEKLLELIDVLTIV